MSRSFLASEPIQRYSPHLTPAAFDYFVEVMAPANKNADGKADIALGEAAILGARNYSVL